VTDVSKLEAEISRRPSFYADDDHFDEACRIIEREYGWRRKRTRGIDAPSGDESQHVWLRRVAYDLITRLIRQGDTELIFDRIHRHRTSIKGRPGAPNIFQSGLKAFFAHRPKNLAARDQERFGKQLMFAFIHFVPPPFLEGFLHQTHAHRKTSDDIVPQFVDWIDESLDQIDDDHGDYRRQFLGNLPSQIRKVKKARKRRLKLESQGSAV
jgi:hypothetical protein